MRILHTSDWHLGKSLEQINRIAEQKEFIDCLCKTMEEQNIDLVLVAGDIYDTYNPSAAAEELFYEAVDRLNDKGKRAVVVIAGNHDNPERLCAASPLAYKNGIILLGYPGSDAAMYKINSENIKIVDSGPGWLELCVPACQYHAVIITLPYPVFYSGSTLAYSFSEAEHSKAVYIIEAVPGEKAEIKSLYLNCGKPLRRWVAEEGIGQAIAWCEEGRDSNAWIDLEILTDRVLTVEEQKALRALHHGIINIRPRLNILIITESAELPGCWRTLT